LARRSQRRQIHNSIAAIIERQRDNARAADQNDNTNIVSGRAATASQNIFSSHRNRHNAGSRRDATANESYLMAIRQWNTDLEEMMIAEAIRLSLLDQAAANQNTATTSGSDPRSSSSDDDSASSDSSHHSDERAGDPASSSTQSNRPQIVVVETDEENTFRPIPLPSSSSSSISSLVDDIGVEQEVTEALATEPSTSKPDTGLVSDQVSEGPSTSSGDEQITLNEHITADV
jgi:hypothetical protein